MCNSRGSNYIHLHCCCCRCLQLLWELDNGRAVGLAGVPDALLRSQLQHTLGLLGLKLTKVRLPQQAALHACSTAKHNSSTAAETGSSAALTVRMAWAGVTHACMHAVCCTVTTCSG